MAITQTVNVPITMNDDDIFLVNSLVIASRAANAVEYQAPQSGTYGLISKALIQALTTALEYDPVAEFTSGDAEKIAQALYWAMLENYEGIDHQIALWNDNKIQA